MIYIEIDERYQADVDAALLEKTALAALTHEQADPQAECSIVVSDDDQLHALNQQFLGIDAPTDVLSFPGEEIDPETGAPYLGDIILSFPRAQAQAASGGHPVSAEVQLLVVHGILHLCGHDHAEPEDKARMWAAQAEILMGLGSPITGPIE
ncbi:MAG TPA: rRNA maturation RNase YbeY [Anaerolineaceae bacterium]|nr:rRNA maturation RNase YbeY [Anaerolineaceae bacterium]